MLVLQLLFFVTMTVLSASVYGSSCGTRTFEQRFKRVVGGQEAVAYSWPWEVRLTGECPNSNWLCSTFCGGTIISDRWILTARHCVVLGTPTEYIIAGMDENEEGDKRQFKKVARIIPHPDYWAPSCYKCNDMALLELEEPLEFNDYVQPVCLDRDLDASITDTSEVYMVGRGREGPNEYDGTLKQFKIQMNTKECHSFYDPVDIERTICGQGYNGEGNTCTGDSGSGAYHKVGGRWFQIGIAAYGRGDCAQPDPTRLNMFARIGVNCNWIDENTGIEMCQ